MPKNTKKLFKSTSDDPKVVLCMLASAVKKGLGPDDFGLSVDDVLSLGKYAHSGDEDSQNFFKEISIHTATLGLNGANWEKGCFTLLKMGAGFAEVLTPGINEEFTDKHFKDLNPASL